MSSLTKMITKMKMLLVIALVSTFAVASNGSREADDSIKIFLSGFLKSVYGHDVKPTPLEVPPALSAQLRENTEFAAAMTDTYIFKDELGKTWLVTDCRSRVGEKFPCIYISSESIFFREDPGNPLGWKWHHSVFVKNDELFRHKIKSVKKYREIQLSSLLGGMQSFLADADRVECDEGVLGDLEGNHLDLRVPIRNAYFFDKSNNYLLLVSFASRGDLEQAVYFSDPGHRPSFGGCLVRPSVIDGTKLVSSKTRKKINAFIVSLKK